MDQQLEAALKLLQERQFKQLEEICNCEIKKNYQDVNFRKLIAAMHYMQGNSENSIEIYRKILEINPQEPEALQNLGKTLYDQQREPEAIDILLKAIAYNPDHTALYLMIISAYRRVGDFIQAEEYSYKLLSITEDNNIKAQAYYNLAICRKFTQEDIATIQKLEELKYQPDINTGNQTNICFSLGKLYNDLEQYDQAFENYHQGNKLQNSQKTQEQAAENISYITNTINHFPTEIFNSSMPQSDSEFSPIFIVGMPRSGSTLTEQVLQRHPDIGAIGESPNLPNTIAQMELSLNSDFLRMFPKLDSPKLNQLADNYMQSSYSDVDKKYNYIADKHLNNFLYLGLIYYMYPNAKIIHCTRNPMDNCMSCYFQNFRSGLEQSFDLENLGKTYKQYEKLMQLWKQHLPMQIYELSYENMVSNHEKETKKLIEFIGLPWDDACLDRKKSQNLVRTASYWQVRQPIYQTSVERWRKYERQLQPLHDIIFSEDNIDDLYTAAINNIRNSQYDAAIELLQKIIEQQPNHADSIIQLANIYYNQKKIPEALKLYNQALGISPQDHNIITNMGYCFFAIGRYQQAAVCFKKALAMTPDNINIMIYLAQTYGQIGELSAAKQYAEQVLTVQPENQVAKAIVGS